MNASPLPPRRWLLVAGALALFGPWSFTKERDPYEAFIEDEVAWILTKDEAKAWKGLKTNEERDAFIALFWARRDPTPGTRRNEFKEEYARRLAYADQHYSSSREKGRESDRGRVYCLLGSPTREGTFALRGGDGGGSAPRGESAGVSGPSQIGGTMRGSLPPILWTYENLPKGYGIPNLEVRFVDYEGFGSYALDSGGASAAALKKAVDLVITQPDLTKAPEYPAGEPEAAVAEAPAPAPVPDVPEALPLLRIQTKEILDLLAKPSPAQGSTYQVAAAIGAFQGSDGLPFTPVAMTLLGSAAPADPVCFLRVKRGDAPVQDVEIAGKAPALHTFQLEPGDYVLQMGVYDRTSKKHGYAQKALAVKAPAAASSLATSSVVLGKTTETLPAAAPETEPFTFGQVRVAPAVDGVFGKADELNIFLEVYGVKEDGTGKGRIAATYAFHKAGKFWNEIPEAEQQAVRLSPGRYLLTQIVPLSRFAPASYELRVTVKDVGSSATATVSADFQVK